MNCSSNKVAYETLSKAYKMIEKQKAKGTIAKGITLRVYPCPKCGKWHLTKKELK